MTETQMQAVLILVVFVLWGVALLADYMDASRSSRLRLSLIHRLLFRALGMRVAIDRRAAPPTLRMSLPAKRAEMMDKVVANMRQSAWREGATLVESEHVDRLGRFVRLDVRGRSGERRFEVRVLS